MKKANMGRPWGALAVVAGVWAGAMGAYAAEGEASGLIEVHLGTTIGRTWEQVQADNYAYGPKQDYDAKTNETHIYLPYGKNAKSYFEVRGVLYDAEPGALAKFHSSDGNTNAVLTFKLHFDKPIGSFRYGANWTEVGLAENTVAGVEYSVDGKEWKTIREAKKDEGGIIEPFVKDFKAEGLNTDTLYIRYYTRDPANPDAGGPGRWIQFWMAGDPSWGDAARTFFERQLQVWVTPAKGGETSVPADAAKGEDAKAVGGSFGICSSAEAFGDHPRLLPLLHEAGVTMVRMFPEWANFQPQQGQWDFSSADALIESARKNDMEILAGFAYLAPWASAVPGNTRTFPIKDIQYWRDYVAGVVGRYHKDVKYWLVWNEFQGFNVNGTVKDYAELVRETYEVAKKIAPQCQIGLGTSSVDVSFLEQAILEGAADHFDFIDVHPYELMGALMDGHEPVFLQIVPNLRKMLEKTRQRQDTPIFVGEIGRETTDKPEDEQRQAEALVKGYVACLGQGIDRVFWFEGRGPYHMGLLRSDKEWTKRPSYEALRIMTGLLGPRPEHLGWLNPTGQSYGFAFQGAVGPVLAVWAVSDKGDTLKFPGDVTVTDIVGKATQVAANQDVALTRIPVFITGLPAATVAQAKANHGKPLPWLKDYSTAESVSCRMGTANVESGLIQLERGDGKTVVGIQEDGSYARRTDRANKCYYTYFDVDDSYASVGDNRVEITVVARRADPAKPGGCNLTYESVTGYRQSDEWWTVPAEPGWHEHTFRVNDANFANNWGWNLRISTVSSPDDIWVKEVIVKRAGAKE